MNVLIVGDLHIGSFVSNPHVEDSVRAALDEVVSVAASYKVQKVIILGDIVDRSDKIQVRHLTTFVSFLTRLSALKISIGAISGNHDYQRGTDGYWDDTGALNKGLSFIRAFARQIEIFDNTCYNGLGGIPFYRNSGDFYKALSRLREIAPDMHTLFIHQTPAGSGFGAPTDEIDPHHECFKGLRHIFCGHIHMPKKINQFFTQTGSLIAINRLETGTRYVYLYDTETGVISDIALKTSAVFENRAALPAVSSRMVEIAVRHDISTLDVVQCYVASAGGGEEEINWAKALLNLND